MTSIHRLFFGCVFFFALISSSSTPSSFAAAVSPPTPLLLGKTTDDSSLSSPSNHVKAPHDNTKTKDYISQSTEVLHAEVFTGAGKTRRLIPETAAGDRFLAKRSRSKGKKKNLFDHHCSIHTFIGQYFYANGCDGLSFNVDISCNDDDDGKCKYEENSIDDICKSTSYMFDPELYIDRDKYTGRCVLGLPAVPLVTPKGRENDECAKEHPHLSVKVVAPMDNQDVPAHLDIYFSDNYGENFYNQDNPHNAERHADAQRRLIKRSAKKEQNDELVDEVEGSTSTDPPEQLEGKELLVSFHVESQRRLYHRCGMPGKTSLCWKYLNESTQQHQYCWSDDKKKPEGDDWYLAVREGDWDECASAINCFEWVYASCWGVNSDQRCFTSLKNRPKATPLGTEWTRIISMWHNDETPHSSCGSECPDVRFNHEEFQCWNNDAKTCYTKYEIVDGVSTFKPKGSDWELQDAQNVCNADICQVQLTCYYCRICSVGETCV